MPCMDPNPASNIDSSRGQLLIIERFWRDRQPWLQECGYMLRPRYRPDWRPSWEGTKKRHYECEDGQQIGHAYILDATRISDGSMVTLKRISKSLHPYETDIGLFFSSRPLASDPRNHCVPIHDILQDTHDEDILIMVMPFLRLYNDPRFETVGEALEFFRQAFEGLQFMHHHHVAHRDIMDLNTMMDPAPMYPEMYHPCADTRKRDFTGVAKHYTRTERPTKYYFVDFGLSRKYNLEDGPPRELPIMGGDKTVPEFQQEGYNEPSDPFATDIYYLGNLIREDFLQKYCRLDFMDALIADMVQEGPQKRPTIDQVVTRFDGIRRSLTPWKLRTRLVSRRDDIATQIFKEVGHLPRTAAYMILRLPSVPTPTS
ncbi:hypothetical protein AcW1_007137 [Taiwanofungus camphoratus]|nr:hypothetical protein AcW1_007137 [Antrodia cinnamomea]